MTNFLKLKNDVLSPEEIELDKPYTFNISPNDSHQLWNEDEDRSRFFHSNMIRVLKSALAQADDDNALSFSLTLEISRQGRLHYHGIIEFPSKNNLRLFYEYNVRRLQTFCTIAIGHVKDAVKQLKCQTKYKSWDDYRFKQKIYVPRKRWEINERTYERYFPSNLEITNLVRRPSIFNTVASAKERKQIRDARRAKGTNDGVQTKTKDINKFYQELSEEDEVLEL